MGRKLGIFLALAALAAALLLAPWALIPLGVGLLGGAAVFFEVSDKSWLKKSVRIVKSVVLLVALAAATWFVIGTPLKPTQASVASRANQMVRGVVEDASVAPRPALSQTELDRLSLREALQNERRKLALIARALYLNEAARNARVRQTASGGADEKLAGALKEFESLYQVERAGAGGAKVRLLAPAALAEHVKRTAAQIDRLEQEGQAGNKSSQELRDFRLGIAEAMLPFETEALFGAVSALQEQLKAAVNLQLAVEQSYAARYDRGSDSLVLEQTAMLRLAENPVSEVDLTGFMSVPDGRLAEGVREELFVRADARPEEKVDPAVPRFKLPVGVRDLVLVKRVTRQRAAEPLARDLMPLQFSQVRVEWPLPREQGVTLTIRPGGAGEEWPYVVPLKVADDAKLARLLMPSYSVNYVHPFMEVKLSAQGDELVPGDAGRLRLLQPGAASAIRVELLPRFLSNEPGQKIKGYLAAENLVAAAVFAVIAVWGVGALKPK